MEEAKTPQRGMEETICTGPEPSEEDRLFSKGADETDSLPLEPTEEITIEENLDQCCKKEETGSVWEDSSTIDGFSEAERGYQCAELYGGTAGQDIDYHYFMQESLIKYSEKYDEEEIPFEPTLVRG